MMLSIQEAAALSGKSARTIREQARTGRLDARRVGGRWLIPRAALDGDPATDTRDARRAEVERLRQHVDAALDEVTGEAPVTSPSSVIAGGCCGSRPRRSPRGSASIAGSSCARRATGRCRAGAPTPSSATPSAAAIGASRGAPCGACAGG